MRFTRSKLWFTISRVVLMDAVSRFTKMKRWRRFTSITSSAGALLQRALSE